MLEFRSFSNVIRGTNGIQMKILSTFSVLSVNGFIKHAPEGFLFERRRRRWIWNANKFITCPIQDRTINYLTHVSNNLSFSEARDAISNVHEILRREFKKKKQIIILQICNCDEKQFEAEKTRRSTLKLIHIHVLLFFFVERSTRNVDKAFFCEFTKYENLPVDNNS